MIRSSYLVAAVLSSILLEAVAISRLQFIGEQTEETLDLVGNDDDSSLGITLSVPYPFFDKPRNILYVSVSYMNVPERCCVVRYNYEVLCVSVLINNSTQNKT